MADWWPTMLGMVAGVCTSFSFVPQIIKAWREGDTEAISMRMYGISLVAFGLWLLHGFMIGSLPVMLFNALNLASAITMLAFKLRDRAGPAGAGS